MNKFYLHRVEDFHGNYVYKIINSDKEHVVFSFYASHWSTVVTNIDNMRPLAEGSRRELEALKKLLEE